ncbi:hypothetical protein DL768_003074 [Monosporascus sp. mg162]|nr:hypothetical protein DL768_003074 [Monosporascus sp. mg162]
MVIKTRFLIVSDTHGEDIPALTSSRVDVAIHCGDLTEESKIEEFRSSLSLLISIDAPLKLVIAGNHDFTLDVPTFKKKVSSASQPLEPELVKKEYGDYGEARQLLDSARDSGVVFLDEGTHHFKLDNGASLTVYASPFTPGVSDWGFQYHPQEGHVFAIPQSADIAITHGPPHGIMDLTDSRKRAGCPFLFGAIARARPKIHCFGHIHEGWGAKLVAWRNQISETPSHFTDIDNNKSTIIGKLSNLKGIKSDTPEMLQEKANKRASYEHDGYLKTSHCSGDEHPVESGSQTLFINAAAQDTSEEYPMHLSWVVEVELPYQATS